MGKELARRRPSSAQKAVEERIEVIRGKHVVLDSDLAAFYGVETRRVTEQMKRNQERFPEDFVFQLSAEEMEALTSQNAMSKQGRGGRRYPPYAFTEQGALQVSGVELKVGDSIIERIATAIAEIDFFLALVSEASHDSNWCRKELALAVTGELGREGVKVLPVRVDGAPMPESLLDVYYLELNVDTLGEVAEKVAAAIPKHQEEQRERVEQRRKARKPVASRSGRSRAGAPLAAVDDEPIRVVGIVEEGIGRPRNDGTRGSALYRIPLRLSRRPSSAWARHFVETWNHPPRFTTMHRPGIASVSGDSIILDGTTMEELERYHVETLRHVLERVNRDVAEHEAQERARAEREEVQRREHDENVRQVASRLKFD